MFLFYFFFPFHRGDKYCAVSSDEYLSKCNKGTPFLMKYAQKLLFNDAKTHELNIFIHESVKPHEEMELTQSQISGRRIIFSGNEFVLALKNCASWIERIEFNNASTISFKGISSVSVVNTLINPKKIISLSNAYPLCVSDFLELSATFANNVMRKLMKSNCRINITGGDLKQIDIGELSYTLYCNDFAVDIDVEMNNQVDIYLNRNLTILFKKDSHLLYTPNIHVMKNNVYIAFINDLQTFNPQFYEEGTKGKIVSRGVVNFVTTKKLDYEDVIKVFDVNEKICRFHVNEASSSYCIYSNEALIRNECIFIKIEGNEPLFLGEHKNKLNVYLSDIASEPICIDKRSVNCTNITIQSETPLNMVKFSTTGSIIQYLTLSNTKLIVCSDALNLVDLFLTGMSEIVFMNTGNKTAALTTGVFHCYSDTNFFDSIDFSCNKMITTTLNTKTHRALCYTTAKKFIFLVDEEHEIRDLIFHEDCFTVKFSDSQTISLVNKLLPQTEFIVNKQDMRITVSNTFPGPYSMMYMPNIKFNVISDISWLFDSSWDNNITLATKRRCHFRARNGFNIIKSKVNQSKIEQLFSFGKSKWEDVNNFKGRYCIAETKTDCESDETYIPKKYGQVTSDFVTTNFNDLFIRVACDDVTIEMSQLENTNIHIYAYTYKRATINFIDAFSVNSLELSFVIAKFVSTNPASIVKINSLYSELAAFTVSTNATIFINSFLRIGFNTYINSIKKLNISHQADLEIVNHKEFSPLYKVYIGSNHFAFQANDTRKIEINSFMYNHVNFVQYTTKKSKITVIPDLEYGSIISHVPSIIFFGSDVYISFHKKWNEMKPAITATGTISVNSNHQIIVICKVSDGFPGIFRFSKKPQFLTYSSFDSQICLYREDSRRCPENYSIAKYNERQQISKKSLGVYGETITFFIADSDKDKCPYFSKDLSEMKMLSFISDTPQYVRMEIAYDIAKLTLINVSLKIKRVPERIVINELTISGETDIICNNLTFNRAFVDVKSSETASKYATNTSLISISTNTVKITLIKELMFIDGVAIEIPQVAAYNVFVENSIILVLEGNFFPKSPIDIHFSLEHPEVKFINHLSDDIDFTTKYVRLNSMTTIFVIGNVPELVKLNTLDVKYVTKICVADRPEECPYSYDLWPPGNGSIKIATRSYYAKVIIAVDKLEIDSSELNSSVIRFESAKPCSLTITGYGTKMLPSVVMRNVKLSVWPKVSIGNLWIQTNSSFDETVNVIHINIKYHDLFERKDILENMYRCESVAIVMPDTFNELVIGHNYMEFFDKGKAERIYMMNKLRIQLSVSSSIVHMSCVSNKIEQTPDITMSKGSILFEGDWDNAEVLSKGILRGVAEAVVKNDLPNHAFIFGNDIKKRVTNEWFCFYKTDEASTLCGGFPSKYRYSATPVQIYGTDNITIYVIDSSPEAPLCIKSYTSSDSFKIVSMEDTQYVELTTDKCSHLVLDAVNCMFTSNTSIGTLTLHNSTVSECDGTKSDITTVVVKSLRMLELSQNISCRFYVYDNKKTKGIALVQKGARIFSRKGVLPVVDVRPFTIIAYSNFDVTIDSSMSVGDKIRMVPNITTIDENVNVMVFCELSNYNADNPGYIKSLKGKPNVAFTSKKVQKIYKIIE